MTALRTMSIRIVDPKAERLIVDLASRNLIEIDEPEVKKSLSAQKTLTPQERFRRAGVAMAKRRKQAGLPEEDPMTMEEVVAICKEVRAERYAKKQEQKEAACR